MSAQWDSSVILGFYAAGILLFLGLVIGGIGLIRLIWFGGEDGAAGSVIAGCIMAICSFVTVAVAWLPGSQYDRFVPYSGTVAKVTSRFIGDNSATTQVFGITFVNGDVRKCNDTRCSALKAGDHASLLCEREFQFNQPNEGWDCNFVGRRI